MPKIESWSNLPARVRQHLIDRMRDRTISIADVNQIRLWIESKPEVPEGTGTKTSTRSKSAVADRFRKRFCFGVKPPKDRQSKKSGLVYDWKEMSMSKVEEIEGRVKELSPAA